MYEQTLIRKGDSIKQIRKAFKGTIMVIDKINYIGNGKYKIRIHQRKYR
jgi:hypothetical protein